jgi:hypothetical protein
MSTQKYRGSMAIHLVERFDIDSHPFIRRSDSCGSGFEKSVSCDKALYTFDRNALCWRYERGLRTDFRSEFELPREIIANRVFQRFSPYLPDSDRNRNPSDPPPSLRPGHRNPKLGLRPRAAFLPSASALCPGRRECPNVHLRGCPFLSRRRSRRRQA